MSTNHKATLTNSQISTRPSCQSGSRNDFVRDCKYLIRALCVGAVILILLSELLFWARLINTTAFFGNSVNNALREQISISPWGLTPDLDAAANYPSRVYSRLDESAILYPLGIFQEVINIDQNGRPRNIPNIASSNDILRVFSKQNVTDTQCIYYDRTSGLLTYCALQLDSNETNPRWIKKILCCAGPEGVSEQPTEKLGQFSGDMQAYPYNDTDQFICFDNQYRRFYRIDFTNHTVFRGPEMPESFRLKDFGEEPTFTSMNLRWSEPLPKSQEDRNSTRSKFFSSPRVKNQLLLIDQNGGLIWFDTHSLTLTQGAGNIPVTHTMNLKDMLAWQAEPIAHQDMGSLGVVCGSISRFGDMMHLAVFDKSGKEIQSKTVSVQEDKLPGGPLYVTIQYFLENLQSPILLAGSYFTSRKIDTISAHQAMLLLPTSFIGRLAYEKSGADVEAFFAVLFLMAPSLMLSGVLAWRVSRDAKLIGISKNIRTFWWWLTMTMGLSAYITYRLTRPAETRVTCENCGQLRRPDQTRCHHCNAPWDIPEIAAPDWRVV